MIREKKRYRRFILGKSSRDTTNGAIQREYRKTIEKCLVASLVLALFFFRLTASFDLERYLVKDEALNLEFIDIQDIPPLTEQPPQLKMEQVVEVVPEPVEQTDDGEIQEIIEEIEELLAENTETELDLDSDMGYLISDSPLDVGARVRLDVRNRLASNDGNISMRRGASYLNEDGGGLDIGSTKSTRRRLQSETTSLDLPVSKEPAPSRPRSQPSGNEEPTLGITGQTGKVISLSSSTIGTDGYPLWNKIISELDRLNKGRYGASSQLKRNRRGFTILVGFDDETRQEIHWRNDGNVWIKVIGKSSRSTLQELQRALSGILRLSL